MAEAAARDQADLCVCLLDPGIRGSVAQGGFDPGALVGDRVGELSERRQAAAPRPPKPRVEQRNRVVEGDVVDLPELLG